MSDPNTPHESDAVWQRNLAALRTVDANLADPLAAQPIPDGAIPATGRDGAPTYKLRTPDGEQWLGHTSMPTVSGPALLRNFDPGDGNVVLVGIGQGVEARLLCERLRANQAVFVLAEAPTTLALALRVHDLAGPLERGRLILIVDEDLGRTLVRFLIDHPGYLPPERMLGWPWLDPPGTDAAKFLVQRSATEVTLQRAAALSAAAEDLSERYDDPPPLPDRPRCLVVCPHVEQAICGFAGDVLTGLGELDWPAASWLGNTPRTRHPLALVHQIAEFGPDMVVLIDAVRGQLSQILPGKMPLASWITPWARLAPAAVDGIGPTDRVFTLTPSVRGRLVDAGLAPSRVIWLGPAVTRAPEGEVARDRPPEYDVVAIADASPLDPAAQGLTLESHLAVWTAARRLIEEQIERYTDDQVERVLEQAESRTGAALGDQELRQEFCDRINAALAQTLVRRAVFEAVLRADLKLCIWGRGWEKHASLAAACQGPLTTSDRATVYASASITLHVDITGNASAELLTAAAAGPVVIARAHPTDTDSNGLAQLLEPGRELLIFKRHSELIGHLKRLLDDESARREMADRARSKLTEQHTMAQRLGTLRSVLAQTLSPEP